MRVFRKALCASVLAVALANCAREPTDTPSTGSADIASGTCWVKGPVETGGQRRLALIVGVGDYKSSKVNDLAGPPNDARRIAALLTSKSYGFPKENVCLLLDADATRAGFESAFDTLVERTRLEDLAVVFFAGHGSQTRDTNGDEPDEWDETLLLHDSRTADVHDLRDDELNGMLARLNARTQHAVLILDSCNSGTATRGNSGLVARFFEPEPVQQSAAAGSEGDGDSGYAGAALTGLVALTAASDGTPALERNAHGIFTDALIQVLSRATAEPMTYAQLARQVAPIVAAESYQIPYFQGDLRRAALALNTAPRPIGWEVVSTGSTLKLSGPPLPGMGVGAELRIFDGAASAADTADPSKALATVAVTELSGVNATARVSAAHGEGPSTVQVGDLAVLVRPADELIKLKVRLRPSTEGMGIPAVRAEGLRERIRQHAETSSLVDLVDKGEAFELSAASDGGLVLWGPENRIRNMISSDDKVAEVLRLHARQRALLQLKGEGGAHFVDNETLEVRIVPARKQAACSREGDWVQAGLHEEQVIPLCHRWHVQVRLSERSPMPLLTGALIMSTDGSIFALPQDHRTVLLRPGETVTFDAPGEKFRGSLPLDTQDHVLVFGTQERNPVAWHELTQTAATRGPPQGSGLQRALDNYLRPGDWRGTSQVVDNEDETTWTMSALTTRVEANSRFLQAGNAQQPVNEREYTLKTFDVRQYLPDNKTTALFKLLEKADSLATAARAADGFGYKQHDWSLSSDEANLSRGIDCSRAVWFAFTRAGLPYNSGNRYLTTADMVGSGSRMAEQFERCPDNDDLRLGDLLVYRSDSKRDGHVVMVVDPRKRIAWGSHGWDGEAKDSGYVINPDTGVEYQRIKYKQDWRRWDRQDMQLKACWRYRKFHEEVEQGTGVPGVQALTQACDERQCRL